MKLYKLLIILSVISILILSVQVVSAANSNFTTIAAPNLTEYGPQDWKTIGKNITNILAGIAQIVLVIMLMYGGVSYITSAGNEEQANKAKGVLTNAIIGIVIVGASWGIITYIISRLGSLG